jgi:hypothetical protein
MFERIVKSLVRFFPSVKNILLELPLPRFNKTNAIIDGAFEVESLRVLCSEILHDCIQIGEIICGDYLLSLELTCIILFLSVEPEPKTYKLSPNELWLQNQLCLLLWLFIPVTDYVLNHGNPWHKENRCCHQ